MPVDKKRRCAGSGGDDALISKYLNKPSENTPEGRIIAAFATPMDEMMPVPRFAEPGFGGTQASAIYNVFGEMNTNISFPQRTPTYPGVVGQFLAGFPVYIGATNTELELSF